MKKKKYYRNGPYPGIVAYSRIGKSWRLPDIVNSALATRQSYGVWTAVANRNGEQCVRASTWTLVYYYHPRYNVWHTSPYSCIRVMVPNSPHGMGWPGRRYIHLPSKSQHQVGIEPWNPARKSKSMTTILLRPLIVLYIWYKAQDGLFL